MFIIAQNTDAKYYVMFIPYRNYINYVYICMIFEAKRVEEP